VSLASRRLNRGDNCNCHARLATKDKLTMSPPTFPIWDAVLRNTTLTLACFGCLSGAQGKIPRTYHHWIDGCSLQHLVPAGSDRICSLCDAESTPSMLVNLPRDLSQRKKKEKNYRILKHLVHHAKYQISTSPEKRHWK